jgi:tRNA dimethylallyltransferase
LGDHPAHQPAIFLFGPTAVGKTSLLNALNPDVCEVVSADSLQVYRGLDIGTAKPSREMRAKLRHHLIDIVDPTQQFDVGEFVRLADEAMGDITSRGRVPIVSGGAGFYLKQLLCGLPQAPPSTPDVRQTVRDQLAEYGLAGMYARLESVDPVAAQRIGPEDEYRITRALEVYESSGRPLSDFPPPSTPRTDLEVRLMGLRRSRAELHGRIARRVEEMFAAGLRAEVEQLVSEGVGANAPGMRGIGYSEFFRADGSLLPPSADDKIAADICTHTRRYSKRQTAFFRGLPDVRWYPADSAADVAADIESYLRTVR